MLRVISPTINRPTTCTTHAVFPEVIYVVESMGQYASYIDAGIPAKNLVVSGIDRSRAVNGKTLQCEWICKNLISQGEWFVLLDDNIRGLTGVHPEYYANISLDVQVPREEEWSWKDIFSYEMNADEFQACAAIDMELADKLGARMVGYATVDNHFFRGKKYREVGFVIGKLTLMKNDMLTWDHSITMDDFRNTADHLFRFGCVLINNFIYPVRTHYMEGGHGTRKERIPFRKSDCEKLMKQYPGLFSKKKPKPDIPDDLHVRFTSRSQVQEWRKSLFNAIRGGKV